MTVLVVLGRHFSIYAAVDYAIQLSSTDGLLFSGKYDVRPEGVEGSFYVLSAPF